MLPWARRAGRRGLRRADGPIETGAVGSGRAVQASPHGDAVLVELGFLSNYSEERIISSPQFREQAALGLYQGMINYFDAQLAK